VREARDGGRGGAEWQNQNVLFFSKAESLDTAFTRSRSLRLVWRLAD
jgi:hypothetical protein